MTKATLNQHKEDD